MKVVDLDGHASIWKPTGEIVSAQDERKRSNLHLTARKLIYEMYPTLKILEEVSVKPRDTVLFFDFFINTIKKAIEVHGEQHYKYNSLYHATAREFLEQRKRDSDKKEWCYINNITYVELPYNEDVEQWREKILL